jgi:hypothetical protein
LVPVQIGAAGAFPLLDRPWQEVLEQVAAVRFQAGAAPPVTARPPQVISAVAVASTCPAASASAGFTWQTLQSKAG